VLNVDVLRYGFKNASTGYSFALDQVRELVDLLFAQIVCSAVAVAGPAAYLIYFQKGKT
jgi:hypothetical protein